MRSLSRLSVLCALSIVALLSLSSHAEARSSLAPGQRLLPGQALKAANGGARLVMRRSGALVLSYRPRHNDAPSSKRKSRPPSPSCHTRRCRFLRPREVWRARVNRVPGTKLMMRNNGRLELVARGKTLWSRRGRPGADLKLTDRGAAELRADRILLTARRSASDDPAVYWSTATTTPQYVGDALAPGESLDPYEFLQSDNGLYQLEMRPDGRLALWVLGAGPCPMWITPMGANDAPHVPGSSLQMMSEGTLAIVAPDGQVVWAWADYADHQSLPDAVAGSQLVLQPTGDVQVVSPSNQLVWHTNSDFARGRALCPGEKLFYGQVLAAPEQGVGSPYTGGNWLEISTYGPAEKGYEIDVGSPGGPVHIFHDKGGPNASGMYLKQQQNGDLQAIVADTGVAAWDTGTDGHLNSFATTRDYNLLIVHAYNQDGSTWFDPVYSAPDADTDLKDLQMSEKISMTMAPMG